MAKVRARLAWMFTNRVWPSGLKVAPANSSLNWPGKPVEGDVEELPAAGEPPQVVVVGAVLAEDQRAVAAAPGDVVGEVQGLRAR